MYEVIKSFYEPNEFKIACDHTDIIGSLEVIYHARTKKQLYISTANTSTGGENASLFIYDMLEQKFTINLEVLC